MSNRVALITGCSSGIGRDIARALFNYKYENIVVYASARNLNSIEFLKAEGMNIVQLDVTDLQSIKDAIKTIVDKEGKLDILVNNAGMTYFSPAIELKHEETKKIMDTNFIGLVDTTIEACKYMIPRKTGLIINIGSVLGLISTPYTGAYCASKAAIRAWSDSLRMELDPFNIKVSIVMPGAIKSEIANNAQDTLQKTLAQTLYEPIKNFIIMRSEESQKNGLPSEAFADYVVKKCLSSRPPKKLLYGPLSSLFGLVQFLPTILIDFVLKKKFGLLYFRNYLNSNSN
ncbi:oxidoreductase [Tieghemostelium lacteum]|uniref:Oxidoreductase n=1 Tax=Tieghemostelium lacteum TaxID=361077 RepID=A0A152A6V5_TIELA|nr:oxidoreductase [Tieghemostelium lacteum]|eukprot:KYR01958.1 oxidoreductase [Tieghemostelium lacteum]